MDVEEKELIKKYRNLAGRADFYPQYSFVKIKNPSSKTIKDLMDFRNEPVYPKYLDVASKIILDIQQKDFEDLPESIASEYPSVKHWIKECNIEKRFRNDLDDQLREISSKKYQIQKEKGIETYSPEWQKLNDQEDAEKDNLIKKAMKKDYLPCDILKKMTDDIANKNSFDQSEIVKKFERHYDHEFLCVITPDITEKFIKDSQCNFQYGIEHFIESFKEQQREEKKQKEWMKTYVSTESIKQYYATLKKMVDTNEVRDEVKNGFVRSIQGETKYSLLHVDELKSKMSLLESEIEKNNDELTSLYKHPETSDDKKREISRKSDKLHKDVSNVYKMISPLERTIQRYWDGSKNAFNSKIVDYDATKSTEDTISNFVSKNTEKLSSILVRRPDCNQFDSKLNVNKGVIEGNIFVKCIGDNFKVNNQLVFVPQGEKVAHYRFPTTFHDIKYKSEFHKMESEQWMNDIFAKK